MHYHFTEFTEYLIGFGNLNFIPLKLKFPPSTFVNSNMFMINQIFSQNFLKLNLDKPKFKIIQTHQKTKWRKWPRSSALVMRSWKKLNRPSCWGWCWTMVWLLDWAALIRLLDVFSSIYSLKRTNNQLNRIYHSWD